MINVWCLRTRQCTSILLERNNSDSFLKIYLKYTRRLPPGKRSYRFTYSHQGSFKHYSVITIIDQRLLGGYPVIFYTFYHYFYPLPVVSHALEAIKCNYVGRYDLKMCLKLIYFCLYPCVVDIYSLKKGRVEGIKKRSWRDYSTWIKTNQASN